MKKAATIGDNMANKVIVKSKKVEEVNDKDGVELRRLNAILEHKDIQEDELKHFGAMGMHWGVRKSSSSGSDSNGSSKIRYRDIPRLIKEDEARLNKNWDDAIKGMPKAKVAGIYMLLGKKWGAEAINKAKAKAADPKEIVKKETKALRKSISREWAKKSDAEFAAVDAQFKAKYGKQPLKDLAKKSGREEAVKRGDIYTKMLTRRMEESLNEIASKQLANTNYKITNVKGFNDFEPEFEITIDD